MRITRGSLTVLLCGLLLLAAGCSQNSGHGDTSGSGKATSTAIGKSDLYATGCPIVDLALGAGSLMRKGYVASLKGIRNHIDLTGQQDQWLNDAIELAQDGDAKSAPSPVRNRVRTACADHGHSLHNLH